MSLLDHFTIDAGTDPGKNGFTKIPIHEFEGSITLWATGAGSGLVTKSLIISRFGLTENPTPDADEIHLDQIAANYTAKLTQTDKIEYLLSVKSSLYLLNVNSVNKTQAMNLMELT